MGLTRFKASASLFRGGEVVGQQDLDAVGAWPRIIKYDFRLGNNTAVQTLNFAGLGFTKIGLIGVKCEDPVFVRIGGSAAGHGTVVRKQMVLTTNHITFTIRNNTTPASGGNRASVLMGGF